MLSELVSGDALDRDDDSAEPELEDFRFRERYRVSSDVVVDLVVVIML